MIWMWASKVKIWACNHQIHKRKKLQSQWQPRLLSKIFEKSIVKTKRKPLSHCLRKMMLCCRDTLIRDGNLTNGMRIRKLCVILRKHIKLRKVIVKAEKGIMGDEWVNAYKKMWAGFRTPKVKFSCCSEERNYRMWARSALPFREWPLVTVQRNGDWQDEWATQIYSWNKRKRRQNSKVLTRLVLDNNNHKYGVVILSLKDYDWNKPNHGLDWLHKSYDIIQVSKKTKK